MASELIRPDYGQWLADLKGRIHQAQQRASLAVNHELIERLSLDLRSAFPEMKGFSRANLLYMRAFAEAWPDFSIVQQAVGRLPWGHNIVRIPASIQDPESRISHPLSIRNLSSPVPDSRSQTFLRELDKKP